MHPPNPQFTRRSSHASGPFPSASASLSPLGGLVAAGLGVTLVPSLAARAVRADVALLPLARSDAPPRTIYAATLHGRTPAPAAKAFIDILRQTAKQIAAPS